MGAFGDFEVRLDPWEAEYGGELAVPLPGVDVADGVEALEVEGAPTQERILFIDGTRILVRHGPRRFYGAFGMGFAERRSMAWSEAMGSLSGLTREPRVVPGAIAWFLSDLGEARGKQELFTRQSPEKLEALRRHALVESAVSSNRIEGVEIEPARVEAVMFGRAALKDRDEEEVRGYRDALKLIHDKGAKLPITEATILDLHRLARGDVWDAGQYKKKDSDIIERAPDGRERVRFRTVPAKETRRAMDELVTSWDRAISDRWAPPLVCLACFNLDFLCVHPFRDGNGRASRLLLLLQCYHLGFEAGRYISLERLIEENKDRYYETLEISSKGWHEGKNDPWPYVGFILSILKQAYRQLEERVGQIASPRGAKTERVLAAIGREIGPFRVADLQRACPEVGVDLIRRILRELRTDYRVECLGRGSSATWRRTRKW